MGYRQRPGYRLLPTQRLFKEGNGQLALGLQGGLIEALEQLEQRIHAALAAGQDKAADLIADVQATARSAQLQGTQLVFIGQRLQLENQRQGQARLQVGQFDWQLARRTAGRQEQTSTAIAQAVE